MTFTEIFNEVVGWTNRPDLDANTRSAIRAATLKYHRKEKFWRDVNTVPLAGLAPVNGVILIPLASLPRFRQAAYVRIPATAAGGERYLSIVSFDDMVDLDGYAKDNIAFFAGTQLNIKSSSNPTTLEVCYWQDPIVSPEGAYSSWIADLQPDLIIASAAAKVFAFDNESEIFKAAVAEEAFQWLELLQNNTETVGH